MSMHHHQTENIIFLKNHFYNSNKTKLPRNKSNIRCAIPVKITYWETLKKMSKCRHISWSMSVNSDSIHRQSKSQ